MMDPNPILSGTWLPPPEAPPEALISFRGAACRHPEKKSRKEIGIKNLQSIIPDDMAPSPSSTSLRQTCVVACAVEWASRGDDASVARLRNDLCWGGDDDADAVVAALLSLSSEPGRIHDQNLRRGICAALTGTHSTRARSAFRTRAFAACFERVFATRLLLLDDAGEAAVHRLADMGAPLAVLSPTVLLHAPGWAARFLYERSATTTSHPAYTRWPQGKKMWIPHSSDLTAIVLRSPRPGAVLSVVAEVPWYRPAYGHLELDPASAMDDPGLLERLAEDREFLLSSACLKGAAAAPYARRLLFHACRTGSERVLEAFEAFEFTASDKRKALELCAEHSPHLAARVGALEASAPVGVGGFMQLVQYGAQELAVPAEDLAEQRMQLRMRLRHGARIIV